MGFSREAIEVEKLMILKEKQTIDENTQKSIELQRAKLLEIMVSIANDLYEYPILAASSRVSFMIFGSL